MPPATIVAAVTAGSPAETAGLKPEDRIVGIDGAPVEDKYQLAQALLMAGDKVIAVDLVRNDTLLTMSAQGVRADGPGQALGDFGVATHGRFLRLANPLPALYTGMSQSAGFVQRHFVSLWEITTGVRPLSELAGPVGIAGVTADTFLTYGLLGLLILTSLLSINVGVINLMPIPVLDGGHLMFMLFEVLRGRPLSPRMIKVCSLGGLCVMMALLLLVTGHDIFRLAL
ncbi:MAG TPA: site-2 protease family protein, partial [Dongiaceae bacterium]|jgi:regulator of sigma E protease